MNDKMKLFQKLHWVSLGIGVGSILLPIFLWKYIPEEIPAHYDAGGMVDRWENKSSMILLFFVIAFLMGMMSIAVYVVKSNMQSKYTSDEEVSVMQKVYPMVVLMNVVLQGIFAYITFCSATGRNLGKWFLPITIMMILLPIVILLIGSLKKQSTRKELIRRYKMQEREEKQACRYRSAIDWWLGMLLGGSVLLTGYLFVANTMEKQRIDWMLAGTSLFLVIVIVPLFFIKYVFYTEHLLVSMGMYGSVRIRYADIVEVKKTNNPLSSAAMSLRRIQIDYVENGVHRMILISPVRRNEFIDKLNRFREEFKGTAI